MPPCECGHAESLHGDRAVTACLGSHTPRPFHTTNCNCTGYKPKKPKR